MLSTIKIQQMKTIIGTLFFFVITNHFGQELNLPNNTQYLADNPFVLNAAYAGIGDNIRIRANGLTQWVGIKNAPDNASVYADMRLGQQSGAGVMFYTDKNGFTQQAGAKFSFAHHIILDQYTDKYLSFGLSYNFNTFKIDIDKFDPSIFDPTVTNNRYTANNNFDIGLLFRAKTYYLAFNAANILNKEIVRFKGLEPNLLRYYQAYTGYVIKGSDHFEIEPSAYYQYYQSDGRSVTDINVKFRKFNENDDYYWGGVSYRFLNDQLLQPLMIGPMAGMRKSGFYLGYSYQVTTNELAAYNSGTHMITIGLDFSQGLSSCPCTQYMTK
jgi:type IX secretion system PorP/SprF family membrane protein